MDRKLLLMIFTCLCLASFFAVSGAGLATMSIDLGSQSIKIGIVKPGVPMEIVLNKDSRRKTPFIIGLKNGERYFGDAAGHMSVKYQDHNPHLTLSADEERGTVVFQTEEGKLSVEALLAMMLWNAREQAEAHAGRAQAISVAAEIAGLNLLQLLTDGSAAGLNYGVFRRKEINEQAQTLLIYDIGATKTTATIVEYRLAKEKNSKELNPIMSTLGIGFNRTLGGNQITMKLRDHLVDVFTKNTKTEKSILENPRGMAKMWKEAERVKQVLSANADHYAQIEGVFEEKDFRTKVTREELQAMFTELEPYFMQPITEALRMAEMTMEKVDQIVLMGGGTRVPRLQAILQEKELGRFLNTDESIALGAVYQAAHLSKGFKVKKFDVQELQIYPLQVSFAAVTNADEEKQEKIVNRVIYGYKSHYPAAKKLISFTSHTNDFSFNLNYGDLAHLSPEQLEQFGSLNICKVEIKDVEPTLKAETQDEDTTFKGVKVHFHLDNYGMVQVDQAELIVERIEKPSNSTLSAIVGKIGEFFSDSKTVKEGQVELDLNKDTQQDTDVQDTSSTEKSDSDNDNKESRIIRKARRAQEEEREKGARDQIRQKKEVIKPKVIKAPLKVVVHNALKDLSTENIKNTAKILADFEQKEKSKAEREAALNSLEATIYDYNSKLEEEEFSKFGTQEELTTLRNSVDALRNWLEEEVSPETSTDDISAKKKEVDTAAKKLKYRKRQKEERPKHVEHLEKVLSDTNSQTEMFKNMPTVFTEVEITTLNKVIGDGKEWYEKKKEKASAIDREIKYLMSKMYNAKLKAEQEKMQKLKDDLNKTVKEAKTKDAGTKAESETAEKDKKSEGTEEEAKISEQGTEEAKGEQETQTTEAGDEKLAEQAAEKEQNASESQKEESTPPHDQSEL
uniref:Hypoxia up-regulated protein 1 n=1 Tax=Ditylenchus dipsaci TaxID=166011 RepID=A0A915CU20_9BILA